MPKRKYDWTELKLQYFQSEIDDVKVFFQQLWSKQLDWNMTNKTKWWAKEKQAYKEKIIKKALEENAKKRAKELQIPIETLQLWKKNALVWIMNDLTKKSDKMSMSDKVKWLNALKTELWEPTTVSKNENVNKNEPLDVNDFIRD
jgi:hypothetical protein